MEDNEFTKVKQKITGFKCMNGNHINTKDRVVIITKDQKI